MELYRIVQESVARTALIEAFHMLFGMDKQVCVCINTLRDENTEIIKYKSIP